MKVFRDMRRDNGAGGVGRVINKKVILLPGGADQT